MRHILSNLLLIITGFIGGVIFIIYRCGYVLKYERKRADKFYSYFNILDKLLSCKERDYNFAEFFNKKNIKTVAIYGMGQVGRHLKYELKKAGIKIEYVIDEGENVIYDEEMHYNLSDKLPLVDIVIVTPITEFEEIKNKILDNNKMLKVVSVSDILK